MSVTRFAPSPTGPLHLGHAFAAIVAHDLAGGGGRFLLRIEDIDRERSKPHWVEAIRDDLRWLGLSWAAPEMFQSTRLPVYRAALQSLWERGLIYPCNCTRRDIEGALSAPQEGDPVHYGPDGPVYPGTCRPSPEARAGARTAVPADAALRLDMRRAVQQIGALTFTEQGRGPRGETGHQSLSAAAAIAEIGDVVLARRGMGTSYHLSVAVDDAAQGISLVTRGEDLFQATWISVIVQKLLGYATPLYHHHALVRDAHGRRLAKRDDARALSKYRTEGATPEDIRAMIGL